MRCNGLVLESTDATPTTDMYLPISTAKAMSHADDGYQSFTVVAATGVDTSAFPTQTENFFAGYYTRNTSYTATASSMESLIGEHDGDALHHQPGHRGHRGHQPAGGGHRRNEYHAGVHHRAHTGDRHPQGAGRDERQPSVCSSSWNPSSSASSGAFWGFWRAWAWAPRVRTCWAMRPRPARALFSLRWRSPWPSACSSAIIRRTKRPGWTPLRRCATNDAPPRGRDAP